jgi:hypothetical protein
MTRDDATEGVHLVVVVVVRTATVRTLRGRDRGR